MPNEGSVTRWIEGVKTGDERDVGRVWDRYFQRLVHLAAAKLPSHRRRDFDEEDVALSAFQNFCARAEEGGFPRLDDRDDLWRVLATITVRKALDKMRHQGRRKRGGGNVLGESALAAGADQQPRAGLAEVLGREPAPEVVAQFADDYQRFLSKLKDPVLRLIALRRLEGQTTAAIAAAAGVSIKTVERKLRLIRALWSEEDQP